MALLIPASAISYIDAELGPSPNSGWINVTWSLGAAVLVSISGRLSNIFGRRYFMLCGAVIAFIGTIVGATGQSIPQMIFSGVLLGVGSGFQEMGFACIMEFIPHKYRTTALGMYSLEILRCSARLMGHSRIVWYFRLALHPYSSDDICFYCAYLDRMAWSVLVDVRVACLWDSVHVLFLSSTNVRDFAQSRVDLEMESPDGVGLRRPFSVHCWGHAVFGRAELRRSTVFMG